MKDTKFPNILLDFGAMKLNVAESFVTNMIELGN